MGTAWEEIETALRESRRELVLTGPSVNERIKKSDLDIHLFTLDNLNFLEISKTCLVNIPVELGNLSSLLNLVLHSNKILSIPASIQNLTKLKFIDLSHNQISSLPNEVNSLVQLQSLLVNGNKLTHLPPLDRLGELHILDASHNEIEEFPTTLTSSILGDIRLGNNSITHLPPSIPELPALKFMDLSTNQLQTVTPMLTQFPKLKELHLENNPLTDRKLQRLATQSQARHVIEYITKTQGTTTKQTGGRTKGHRKNKTSETEVNEISNLLKVVRVSDACPSIVWSSTVSSIRPYIVACIVQHVNLAQGQLKKFISLQTKLHEGICQKRQVATIATHDYAAIKWPLTYEAKPPNVLKICPLQQSKIVTASDLVDKLYQEAEQQRKEKKRNQLSGLHKYLQLVRGQPLYSCLIDRDHTVVSLPPITNSECTKVKDSTQDLLLEVTSPVSLDECKKVMEELVKETFQLLANTDDDGKRMMTLQQVKVTDIEGQLKVVYPSRIDLTADCYSVERE